MKELELVTRLRSEVPLADASPNVQKAVLTAISATDRQALQPRVPAQRGRRPGKARAAWAGLPRRYQSRVALACVLVLAACAGAVGAVAASRSPRAAGLVAWSGRPTALGRHAGFPGLGPARTESELIADMTRVAATAGPVPGPHDWIFFRTEVADSSAGSGGFLFGPPDERRIVLQWVRADGRESASAVTVPASLPPSRVVTSQLTLSPIPPGTLGGWKSVSYSYLSSLPASPAALEAIMLAQNKPGLPWYVRSPDVAIFNAIFTLLSSQTQGVWIPPRLAATMYRVLRLLPGVHFEPQTDLAGRSGLGLYLVIDGWYKEELVINPVTYAYMGDKSVAVRAHLSVATDGTRKISRGQVLGWEALLDSAIVQRPGQLP